MSQETQATTTSRSSRWILDTVPRIMFSAAAVILGVWVLWHLLAPPMSAEARIYQEWLQPLDAAGDVDPASFAEGQVERASVQGRELFYVRETMGGSHDEILDDIEHRIRSTPGPGLLATLPEGSDPAELWPDMTPEQLDHFSLQRSVVRMDADGWGGLAYVEDGCPSGNQAGNNECVRDRIEAFAATHDASELGRVRSVVAIDGGNPYGSTVFHVWAEHGFHIGAPEDPADRRAPRLAPPGFETPPYCSIVSSYDQPGKAGGFQVATYDCDPSCTTTLADLDPLMRSGGWRVDPVNETLRRNDGPIAQRYAISGREALVTCDHSEHGDGATLGVTAYIF